MPHKGRLFFHNSALVPKQMREVVGSWCTSVQRALTFQLSAVFTFKCKEVKFGAHLRADNLRPTVDQRQEVSPRWFPHFFAIYSIKCLYSISPKVAMLQSFCWWQLDIDGIRSPCLFQVFVRSSQGCALTAWGLA
jgi:hypothetical protein